MISTAQAALCACGCGAPIVNARGGRVREYLNKSHAERARLARRAAELAEAEAAKAAVPPALAPRPTCCAACPVARLSPGFGAVCSHHARPMSVHYLGVPGRVLRARGLCPWGRE